VTTPPARPGAPSDGVEALLSDGTVVTVRPATPEDLQGLLQLHREASDRSRRMRFFAPGTAPAEEYARHLAEAPDEHLAVVAARGEELIGVASAEPLQADGPEAGIDRAAEVALFVSDRWQHTGVGTLLLEHLAAAARAAGAHRFEALVLTENLAMFDVFAHAGFTVHRELPSGGVIVLGIDLEGSPALAMAVAERERLATVASVAHLLRPSSAIVIGASRGAREVGHAVLRSIVAGGFTGRLAAVNHHARSGQTIAGVPAFRSVAEVPFAAELAIVAVPAAAVPGVLEDCGRAGVRGAVVLTAGFAEAGAVEEQAEVVRIAHRHGLRMIGPNCLGVLNTDPDIRLNATFGEVTARVVDGGGVAVAAQSGALGLAVLDVALRRGLGVSGFVSLGNKADVSGNDMLLYWDRDPRTHVIALYLESIGNPRRFRRIASQVSRNTPIVVLRSGRSVAGARAGRSHTAAAATPDAAGTALLRDAGVISADTTEELIDIVQLVDTQPVPTGRRIVIFGNGGGLGALAADAAEGAGASVPGLSPATRERLAAAAGPAPSLENPVDLGAGAAPERYREAIRILVGSGEADAVLVLHVVTQAQPVAPVVAAVEQAVRESAGAGGANPVTVAGALVGAQPPRGEALPWYGFAESAARAVARAGGLGVWRSQAPPDHALPTEVAIPPDVDVAAVTAALESVPHSPTGWLSARDAARLLELIGVPVCPIRAVTGAEAAAAAAAGFDGPVAVKSAAPDLTHKSERGAVALGLTGEAEVIAAARRIVRNTGSAELVVQPMVRSGLELLIGLSTPPGGVPIAMVAAGGVHEAVLADRVLRTLPLAPGTAERMIGDLRTAPLLYGHRGSPPLDTAAVADCVNRIALLDVIAPQIRELDVNPLVVGERGVVTVDAKVRIAVPGEPPPRRDYVHDRYERALG